MSYRITWAVVLGLVLGICQLAAAETFDREQAVRHALAHNPDLLALREQVSAAGGRTRVAEGARLPSLGLSYSTQASNNPLAVFGGKLNTRSVTTQDFDPARLNHPDTSDLHTTQLALRLPVYAGGRLSATLTSAEEMEKNARLQYARAREVIAFQTQRAYLNVQAAQEGLAIADDAVKAAQEHARTTAQLVREGRIVTSDKLTAEVNLAAVQSQREQAATRLESAHNQLKLIMGLPLETEITLAPASFGAAADAANLADLEARALTNRQDLAGVRAMHQAAKARVQAARAAHKPNVDVIATSDWFDDNPGFDAHSSSIMGVVSLDLYAGGRHEGEISAALAEEREAQWHVQSLEQAARHDVREAWENLRQAKARHASAADNAVRARENVRLVKQRYGQGRTILIDLLQAERAYTDARSEELVSRVNLEVGQAALQLAEGALPLPPGETP